MPSVNQRAGVVAFARQSDVGVMATDPTYALPIVSGGLKSNRDRAVLPTTRPTSARSGEFVQRAWGGGDQTVLAYEEPVGLLIASCMGSEASPTSLGGGLTQHVFTMSEQWTEDPLTFWSLVGDEWEVFEDCYVTKLVIAGTSGENVTVQFSIIGKPLGPLSGLVSGDPTPNYTLVDDEPRAKYLGSDFWIEADDGTPVSASIMENFELSIDRTPATKYGQFLYPAILIPKRDIDFSCQLVYDDEEQGWDFYHASQQGDAAGQAPDQTVVSGSFAVKCGRHPDDAVAGLTLYNGPPVATVPDSMDTANWDYRAERPDANPTPDALMMEVGGLVRDPGDGDSEITVELVNAESSAY